MKFSIVVFQIYPPAKLYFPIIFEVLIKIRGDIENIEKYRSKNLVHEENKHRASISRVDILKVM